MFHSIKQKLTKPLRVAYHKRLKRKLLKSINGTYCRISTSPEYGVGVFAIRDIPAGIDPFQGPKKRRWLKMNIQEIEHLGPAVVKMAEDFCTVGENGNFNVYEEGFNGLHIRWFLNHSKTPNMETTDSAMSFRTLCEVKQGEELFYDYGCYDRNWR